MRFMLNRWGYGTMAVLCGLVMAFAMSQRYGDWLIFWVGAPMTLAATVGLLLWARHDERKALTRKTLGGEPQDE